MSETPLHDQRGGDGTPGSWRAVLAALDSNGKTARLVVILLTLAVVGAIVATATAMSAGR